jgi:hypothetical protein
MAIEQTIIPTLTTDTGVAVRALHGEQLDDLLPAEVPLVIVSRVGTYWGDWDTFCAGNTALAEVTIQVDYIDITLEGARRLADIGRRTLTQIASTGPESEFDVWEPGIRVYRVTQLFSISDYNPSIV